MKSLKPVTVTFPIHESVAHEIVARIYASGEKPTAQAVRDEARHVYAMEGNMADVDPQSIVLNHYVANSDDVSDDDSLKATMWLSGLGWAV